MTALELLTPKAAEAVPFSLRQEDRQFAERADAARAERARLDAARADRRAHERRTAGNLDWLSTVRLTGGTGYDVSLIDLSEGGALLEVNAPLRPGLILTLEMSGPGLDAAVPLEVVRCYIASIRGETATYRGAVTFAHLIQLPGSDARRARVAADFVSTDAALTHLLERCTSSRQAGASSGSPDRKEVLRVLDALRMRTAARGSDLLSRHASDLLAAILPPLHDEAGDVALAALEHKLRGLPPRWRSLLQPTGGRLASLIAHCATAPQPVVIGSPDAAALPVIWDNPTPGSLPGEPRVVPPYDAEVGSGFQKIVARYADGKLLKGYAQDFYPTRPQFTIWPSITASAKERIVVPMSQLKAVFFVRDFQGNPSYKERKAFGVNSQGRRVDVTFKDGESVLGTTLNYRPDGQGFFVTPADPDANNARIYVVAKSVRRVRFL